MSEKKWQINLTNIDGGIFRTMNGNADEMIAIGRVIKAGFPCSRVDVTSARYDAIVDIGGSKKLLKIQIKGSGNNSVNFIGGSRSGKQISRVAEKRNYKYTANDCDLVICVDTNNGDCYIIPIEDIAQWGNNRCEPRKRDVSRGRRVLRGSPGIFEERSEFKNCMQGVKPL